MEHAQMSEEDARLLLQTCDATGIAGLVRVPDPSPGDVNRLLEAGASGVVMPRLRTLDDAQALRGMLRFPPFGRRSVGKDNPLSGYGTVPVTEYLERADSRTVAIGQFETREIDDDLDAVMECLDVAFLGLMDLSVDLGVPGKLDAPAVAERVRLIEASAHRCGTALGAVAGNVQAARRLISAGYRFIALGSDVTFLVDSVMPVVSQIFVATSDS
jgi:4-hydroxy-2-oxoheptanedioate aldolase